MARPVVNRRIFIVTVAVILVVIVPWSRLCKASAGLALEASRFYQEYIRLKEYYPSNGESNWKRTWNFCIFLRV